MLGYFEKQIFKKDLFDNNSIRKREYQYAYSSAGSFNMISKWITEDSTLDLDTMAKWITEINAPLFTEV